MVARVLLLVLGIALLWAGCAGTEVVLNPTPPNDVKIVQFKSNFYDVKTEIPVVWEVALYGPGVPVGPEVIPDPSPTAIVIASAVRSDNGSRFTLYFDDLRSELQFFEYMRMRRPNGKIEIERDQDDREFLLGTVVENLVGPPLRQFFDIYALDVDSGMVFLRAEIVGNNEEEIDEISNEVLEIIESLEFEE